MMLPNPPLQLQQLLARLKPEARVARGLELVLAEGDVDLLA